MLIHMVVNMLIAIKLALSRIYVTLNMVLWIQRLVIKQPKKLNWSKTVFLAGCCTKTIVYSGI